MEGTGSGRPSAIPRMVRRRILPERVFGSPGTTTTSWNAATGPTRSRTADTTCLVRSSGSIWTPDLSTTNALGAWPFRSSATPMTAHSATAGWDATTASMTPVDSR